MYLWRLGQSKTPLNTAPKLSFNEVWSCSAMRLKLAGQILTMNRQGSAVVSEGTTVGAVGVPIVFVDPQPEIVMPSPTKNPVLDATAIVVEPLQLAFVEGTGETAVPPNAVMSAHGSMPLKR